MFVCVRRWCQLKEEIGRCEVLKMDNIHRVVGAVRQQLKDWQDRCCISDDTFEPLHDGQHLYIATAARLLQKWICSLFSSQLFQFELARSHVLYICILLSKLLKTMFHTMLKQVLQVVDKSVTKKLKLVGYVLPG